ncbi:MAG: hypothetical protein JWR10_908 [Rubritepida sp.]|nr:hypothetical protein [Rubritepida sp.]
MIGDRRAVAVGNEVIFVQANVFNEFLDKLIPLKLGQEWYAGEAAKPAGEQHPIIAWREVVKTHLESLPRNELGYAEGKAIGAAAAYFGLAYSFYLIQHNAKLLDRMLKRLRLPEQFQGAYFELVMISCLFRAGFKIELVDETGRGLVRSSCTPPAPTGGAFPSK